MGGAGYPAAVAGWLPLCVASIPNAAPNNDTVTFWDVRPMLQDRARGVSDARNTIPILGRIQFNFQTVALAGGWCEAILEGGGSAACSGAVHHRRRPMTNGVGPARDFVDVRLDIYGPGGGGRVSQQHIAAYPVTSDGTGVATAGSIFHRAWVPLASIFPFVVGTTQRVDIIHAAASGATITANAAPVCRVLGWLI